ncbi:hypothetical protein F511_46639 [Dorcoceras hygrometricum]|uniref:Uncharacterized protein n=1 Tax=Dorcoceras hygrometricum TaxID=472368 RepID=A0A2Z6ZT08_9LAMI|nr:hypothetical protein F511_46639 [Dorcoceras hygrometricum]
MSTLKAVKTAQFIPHSFNLPQQISPGKDNRTTLLLRYPLQGRTTASNGVAIERASHNELSATKIIQNNG